MNFKFIERRITEYTPASYLHVLRMMQRLTIDSNLKGKIQEIRTANGKTTKKLSHLKDKSGLDKIIVKKQPYQLLNTNREFFPSFLMHQTFINWLMNLRKLGQISSPFCILYEYANA